MSGSRDSQWFVLRRCLQMLVCLLHSPVKKQKLLAISSGDDVLSESALESRFQKDLKRLREILQCHIDYDRKSNSYILTGIEQPLIDLSAESLQGLAFLQSTFHTDAPMSDNIRHFVNEIVKLLPKERQTYIQQASYALTIDLQPKDNDEIPDDVWQAVHASCAESRQLEFEYYSPSHDDEKSRKNLVEPYRYYFDTQRGHYYLFAFCLEVSGPHGTWERREFSHYRLGRIRQPQVLPSHFVKREQEERRYTITYHLIPQVARFGVTHHFPDSLVTYHEDGSAIVEARVTNLFMSLKTLLYYGESCRVLGDELAVDTMRNLVQAMCQIYTDI